GGLQSRWRIPFGSRVFARSAAICATLSLESHANSTGRPSVPANVRWRQLLATRAHLLLPAATAFLNSGSRECRRDLHGTSHVVAFERTDRRDCPRAAIPGLVEHAARSR